MSKIHVGGIYALGVFQPYTETSAPNNRVQLHSGFANDMRSNSRRVQRQLRWTFFFRAKKIGAVPQYVDDATL